MKKFIKATAVSASLAAVIGAFAPSANANPLNWVLSPDANATAFGVTVVDGVAQIGAADSGTQPSGIFGAGFMLNAADYNGTFSMDFDADLYSWDSYNPVTTTGTGYFDAFVVTVSTTGYYWNSAPSDPVTASASTWVWGGTNWNDGILDSYISAPGGPLDMVSISGPATNYYVSVVLDTKSLPQSDSLHPSWGSFHVTPIPEPETYAMLLAGLGLMGFVARRRRQSASA